VHRVGGQALLHLGAHADAGAHALDVPVRGGNQLGDDLAEYLDVALVVALVIEGGSQQVAGVQGAQFVQLRLDPAGGSE